MVKDFQIRVFGPFEARDADGQAIEFSHRKVRALIPFLAVEHGRSQTSERLASLLWARTMAGAPNISVIPSGGLILLFDERIKDDRLREILSDVAREWPLWRKEVEQAFQRRPVSIHLAFLHDSFCAFSAYDVNNFDTQPFAECIFVNHLSYNIFSLRHGFSFALFYPGKLFYL